MDIEVGKENAEQVKAHACSRRARLCGALLIGILIGSGACFAVAPVAFALWSTHVTAPCQADATQVHNETESFDDRDDVWDEASDGTDISEVAGVLQLSLPTAKPSTAQAARRAIESGSKIQCTSWITTSYGITGVTNDRDSSVWKLHATQSNEEDVEMRECTTEDTGIRAELQRGRREARASMGAAGAIRHKIAVIDTPAGALAYDGAIKREAHHVPAKKRGADAVDAQADDADARLEANILETMEMERQIGLVMQANPELLRAIPGLRTLRPEEVQATDAEETDEEESDPHAGQTVGDDLWDESSGSMRINGANGVFDLVPSAITMQGARTAIESGGKIKCHAMVVRSFDIRDYAEGAEGAEGGRAALTLRASKRDEEVWMRTCWAADPRIRAALKSGRREAQESPPPAQAPARDEVSHRRGLLPLFFDGRAWRDRGANNLIVFYPRTRITLRVSPSIVGTGVLEEIINAVNIANGNPRRLYLKILRAAAFNSATRAELGRLGFTAISRRNS